MLFKGIFPAFCWLTPAISQGLGGAVIPWVKNFLAIIIH